MKIRTGAIRIAGAVLAAIALAFAASVHAASAVAHEHQAGASAALKLNAGKKWGTDEPLRQGMASVKSTVAKNLAAVHAGKVHAAKYKAIAGELNGQVAIRVQNCKLDKDADEVLHAVLAQVLQGAEAMEGKDKKVRPRAGFLKVVDGLDSYGKHFDHSGWQPVKTGH
ncbi:MAG: hypothetical protein HY017_22480 [Betaproteobacteria bacterium]|nr:hypothetical protein [Betaproteobacteria bacterium]